MRQIKIMFSVRIALLVLLAAVFVGQSVAQSSSPNNKEKVDLLINGGTIVTMDGDRLILEDGAVVVKGDVISAIGFRTDLEKKYIADQTIDARGKLVLPGFINGHTHVPMTLFRGLHDDVTLDEWLHKYIFPAEAKNVTQVPTVTVSAGCDDEVTAGLGFTFTNIVPVSFGQTFPL